MIGQVIPCGELTYPHEKAQTRVDDFPFPQVGYVIVPWRVITNTETNIARENGWLEDDTSFWDGATWQVRTVSFRENIIY